MSLQSFSSKTNRKHNYLPNESIALDDFKKSSLTSGIGGNTFDVCEQTVTQII